MAKTWQCLVLKSTTTAEKSYSQKLTCSQALCTFFLEKIGGISCKNFQWKTDLAQFLPGRPSDFVSYLAGSQLCSWHNFKC